MSTTEQTKTAAIVVRESALARLDPQALISKALETGAGIDTMERLVALAKDVREVQAKEAWYEAMAEFQRTCPTIKKTATAKIQTPRASFSYKFAPLDEILSVIQPVMGPLGLSVSWRHRFEPTQVVVSCRVSHMLGHHEESGDLAMPIMQPQANEGQGANAAQRVGISTTYAKRYSLLGIIGMAPEDDDDGQPSRGEHQEERPQTEADQLRPPGAGAVITEPQAKRFWAIAREHKWTDEQIHDLLTSKQLSSTKEITVVGYDAIIDQLKAGWKKAAPQGTLA